MMMCLDMGLFGLILFTKVVMIFCGLYIVCHMMPPAFPLPEHYWSLQCPHVLDIITKLCKSGSCPLSQHHCQQKGKIRCEPDGIKSQQGWVREGCQDSWMGRQTSQSPCMEGVVQFYSNLKGQDPNWCSAKILTQKSIIKKKTRSYVITFQTKTKAYRFLLGYMCGYLKPLWFPISGYYFSVAFKLQNSLLIELPLSIILINTKL